MDTDHAVAALAALAQHSRLAVFRWLVERGPEGAFAGRIAEHLGIAPATLSFHLKTLQHAGLVHPQRQGRHIVYRADFAVMQALLDHLSAHCCGGDAAACLPAARTDRPKRKSA